MENNDTRRRLQEVTGAGLVERLATLMPRKPDSRLRRLGAPRRQRRGLLGNHLRDGGEEADRSRPSTILILAFAPGTFHTPCY